MGTINGRVIYSPKGKAGEYAENAANFFVGCSNGCTYCYLRKGRGAKVLGGSRPEQPRIYWKDSIVNPLGIDRGELPGYCVPVNWDLFNNEK